MIFLISRCRACDAYIDGDVTDISNHEKESDHRKLLANGKVIHFISKQEPYQFSGHRDRHADRNTNILLLYYKDMTNMLCIRNPNNYDGYFFYKKG